MSNVAMKKIHDLETEKVTGYKLAIPLSMRPGERFSLGNVHFINMLSKVIALDPIPNSWLKECHDRG